MKEIKNKKALNFIGIVAAICLLGIFCLNSGIVIGSMYFDGGTGTSEDPYQITTVEQLQNIEQEKSAHYNLMNDIDASVTSTWNEGKGFDPIGAHYNPTDNPAFTGTFDGQNYTISNLYINRPDETSVALFGGTSNNAVIKNLKLSNCDIEGYRMTAGVVGSQYDASVSNICVIGAITGHWEDTAGIVAWSKGDITNCYVFGTITGVDSAYRIGGLVARAEDGSLTNSYSIASVICSGTWKGGLVGFANTATATNCYWNTETSGQATSYIGTGLTTAEMKLQESYVDWDFTDVWSIDSNENNGYPYLSFNEPAPTTPTTPSSGGGSASVPVVVTNETVNEETVEETTTETEENTSDVTATLEMNSKTSSDNTLIYILSAFAIIALFGGFYIGKSKK